MIARLSWPTNPDKRNAWLRKLDEECPYQVVLAREDEYAIFVRYCFEDPLDAAIFHSRFESKVERFKLAS
jgi:hypothetical protein